MDTPMVHHGKELAELPHVHVAPAFSAFGAVSSPSGQSK
jgi:hypothetical protein